MNAFACSKFLSLRRFLAVVLLAGLLALLAAPAVVAQTEDLALTIHRDFGFSSQGQIRGTFTLQVRGPDDLQSVTYFIDGQPVGEATAAPWKFQFQTTDYAFGSHDLSATGETTGGTTLQSNVRTLEFVSADQELSGVKNILGPILLGVGAIMVVVMGLQYVMFRKNRGEPLPLGEPRNYGASGGTICSKCHRPFPLHFLSPNLGPGLKLETCPHCGKMGLVRRRSERELLEAEKAERTWGKPQLPVAEQTEADKLRDQLDDSRYTS